jgi:hypothetical protein
MTSNGRQTVPLSQRFWPNRLGRFYLLSLEDVLGRDGLDAVLNQAKLRHLINNFPLNNLDLGWSFEEMSAVNQAVEDIHGPRGSGGLALRAGRASLYYLRDDLGAVVGMSDLAFRLLPLGTKMKVGLHAIADTLTKTSDQIVQVVEAPDSFLFQVNFCPVCWGRTAFSPICYAHLGLLQEGMHWATNGRHIRVEEIRCIAKGDPSCTYAVDKEPLV